MTQEPRAERIAARIPRFLSVELEYGAHRRRFRIPRSTRPVVLAGPNGAGKTTLLEALVRTLYGFNRRSPEERERLQARRPWEGAGFRATVTIESGNDVLVVTRDFESDQVSVRRAEGGAPLFEGEAKPMEARESHRRYRELLAARFGLDDLGPYERTACVRQGALVQDTRIGEELLRIAAGGHAAVDAAREMILAGHYRLTREPIADGTSGKRSSRELEELRGRLAEERAALTEARAAEAKRRPLVEEARRANEELAALDAEIAALEAALGPLAERRALEAARVAAADRQLRLEERLDELDAALAAREAARTAEEEAGREGAYPPDFEARAGALQVLWSERSRARREDAQARREAEASFPVWGPAAIAAGGLVALAALVVWATTGFGAAAAFLVPGLLSGLAGWVSLARVRARRRAGETRRAEIEEELRAKASAIADLVAGVPEAPSLTADSLPDRLRRFRLQREARAESQRAARQVETAVGRAAAALRELRRRRDGSAAEEVAPATAGTGEEAGGADPTPVAAVGPARARDVSGAEGPANAGPSALQLRLALQEERRREAAEMARLDVRLETSLASGHELPEGVAPAASAVESALAARRRRRAEAAERLRELEVAAATEGRAASSPIAIQSRIAALEERVAEVEEGVDAHRHAWRLLDDAYEQFRATDQERLLGCISEHLAALADGGLGPLESADGLERTVLRAFGRSVPLTSPPLSYGELHAVLLAARLGAVDFLAGAGIHLPLLVDEPFAHLDPTRAAEVWRLLCRVARERQVIVATQDTLILQRLRVEPDLVLPEPVQREFEFDGGGESGGGGAGGGESGGGDGGAGPVGLSRGP